MTKYLTYSSAPIFDINIGRLRLENGDGTPLGYALFYTAVLVLFNRPARHRHFLYYVHGRIFINEKSDKNCYPSLLLYSYSIVLHFIRKYYHRDNDESSSLCQSCTECIPIWHRHFSNFDFRFYMKFLTCMNRLIHTRGGVEICWTPIIIYSCIPFTMVYPWRVESWIASFRFITTFLHSNLLVTKSRNDKRKRIYHGKSYDKTIMYPTICHSRKGIQQEWYLSNVEISRLKRWSNVHLLLRCIKPIVEFLEGMTTTCS